MVRKLAMSNFNQTVKGTRTDSLPGRQWTAPLCSCAEPRGDRGQGGMALSPLPLPPAMELVPVQRAELHVRIHGEMRFCSYKHGHLQIKL